MVEAKTTRKRVSKPKIVEEAIPTESEAEWATADDLPVVAYRDITLPLAQKKVRVRFLTNAEVASMALLPDLARFSQLMNEMMGEKAKPPSLPEQMELMRERLNYLERAAHLCVIPAKNSMKAIKDCLCDLAPHGPVLWTREQVTYLDHTDLSEIVSVAERLEDLARVRPLSQALMEDDSLEPANTGESTPPTSSSEETPAS